jgi:hypothetical protein
MSENWNEMRKRAYWKEQLAAESPSPAPAVGESMRFGPQPPTQEQLAEDAHKEVEKDIAAIERMAPAPAVGELAKELRWLKNNLNHVIMSGEKERLRLAIEEAVARIMTPPVGELTDADFEKIMEMAESAYRRFRLEGLRNQTVTMQDDLAWWVAKETMAFFTARIEQLEAGLDKLLRRISYTTPGYEEARALLKDKETK